MYLGSNINQQIYRSTTCNIEDGKATISLDIEPKYFHALNAIHGSIYFKLLDDAAFFAVNSLVTDVFVLTTSFNISLLRPVQEGRITAIGMIKFNSRNLFVAESTLFNELGKEIAFGTGNFTKRRIQLSSDIGYK